MNAENFLRQIRDLIAADELEAALLQLRGLLEHSPKLDEAILQSGRFQDIRKQIRTGTVSYAEASLTKNQIRAGLLDLLREIEESVGVASSRADATALGAELARAITVVSSKNVASGSTISAGGSVNIGDRTETHYHYGERRIPRALTPPPFLPEVFLGREDDLQRIHNKLFAPGGHLLLLVNGEGGVGKTSVASKYFHLYQHEYAHVAWVLSEKSIAGALLLLALPMGVQFEDQMDTDQRLEVLLTAMANLQKPCLLVLDNANELPDLEAHYLRLRKCANFHLLLTTRIREFEKAETYPIEGLPEKEALEMFQRHYQALSPEEHVLFLQIREAVGGNTLVLELLAKNLKQINRLKKKYTLADLLSDLQKKGLLQLTQTQAVRTEYQSKGMMRREKPEDIIAAMYDLGELPPEETALLSVFAVLPAESLAFSMLETLLPGTEGLEERLLALAQKGWIGFTEPERHWLESGGDFKSAPDSPGQAYFKCSPVVQEVTRLKNEDLYSDCQVLIDTLIEKLLYEPGSGHFLNASYEEALHFTRYAEAVMSSFVEPYEDISILCERIGNYHITTGNLDKSLFFFEKNIQMGEALCAAHPEKADFKNGLAISYSKFGETNKALGDLDKALTFFELCSALEKELYDAYPQNVSFKNGFAISYLKLGETHTVLGNLNSALNFYEKYNELREELYDAYPQNVSFKNGLAISYSKLGNTHSALGNLDRALTFFEQHIALMEELHEEYPLNVEFKLNYGWSNQFLGITQATLGNLNRSLVYFEKMERLFEELYAAYPQNVSFKNGSAISYQFLGNTHTMLGNLERALSFYEKYNQLEKELYEAYPQSVSFKNGLASSYSKLGVFYRDLKNDPETAKPYFQQCYTLIKELSEAYPAYVEFTNNFNWVKDALG